MELVGRTSPSLRETPSPAPESFQGEEASGRWNVWPKSKSKDEVAGRAEKQSMPPPISQYPEGDEISRIRKRAYEIYLERGSETGSELEDWLQAEQEISLTAEQRPNR